MCIVDFDKMPDTTRLWIYSAKQRFTPEQVKEVQRFMPDFLQQWTAHKRELLTSWKLMHEQFIMVAVNEEMMAASGCSIDAMVKAIVEFERTSGVTILTTRPMVFYRDSDDLIQCVERPAFRRLLAEGTVDVDTIVFNNAISTLAELRGGKWELPVRDSWHASAFSVAV